MNQRDLPLDSLAARPPLTFSRRGCRLPGAGLATMLLAALLAGCQEDQAPPIGQADDVLVQVVDRDQGTPQANVKLVLMDVQTNRLARGPVLTGGDGTGTFRDLAAGQYTVLAFPGGGRGLFHLPGSFAIPAADGLIAPDSGSGRDGGGLLRPDSPAAAGVQVLIQTYVSHQFADQLPRISGTIIDAASGAPLAGAFVSLPPTAIDAYIGRYAVSQDVTGIDGDFHVADLVFAEDAETHEIFQLLPLIVSREGYAPVAWFHVMGHGDVNLDITGAVIALSPLTGQESGRLIGRARFLGNDLVDLPVGIAWLAGPDVPRAALVPGDAAGAGLFAGPAAKGAAMSPRLVQAAVCAAPDPAAGLQQALMTVGTLGQVARTDSSGGFQFANLPPGWYSVHPGYLRDDGYTRVGILFDYTILVSGVAVADVGTLPLARTIQAVSPGDGQSIQEITPTFRWTAIAEADSYQVILDGEVLAVKTGAEYALPQDRALAPGAHAWSVAGAAVSGDIVAVMDDPARFTVRLPVPGRAGDESGKGGNGGTHG